MNALSVDDGVEQQEVGLQVVVQVALRCGGHTGHEGCLEAGLLAGKSIVSRTGRGSPMYMLHYRYCNLRHVQTGSHTRLEGLQRCLDPRPHSSSSGHLQLLGFGQC